MQLNKQSFDIGINLQGVKFGVSAMRHTNSYFATDEIGALLQAGKNVVITTEDDFSIKGGMVDGQKVIVNAKNIHIEDVLNTARSEGSTTSASAGVMVTWSGEILPYGSISASAQCKKLGKLYLANGITGESVVINGQSLTYNKQHLTPDVAELNVLEIIEQPRLGELYSDIAQGASGGITIDKAGKAVPNIGASVNNDGVVISGYWSENVFAGYNFMKDKVSELVYPAAKEAPINSALFASKEKELEAKKQTEELAEAENDNKGKEQKSSSARLADIDAQIMSHPDAQVQLGSNDVRRLAVVATVDKLLEANPEMPLSKALSLAVDAVYEAEANLDNEKITPAGLPLVAAAVLSTAARNCMTNPACATATIAITKYVSDLLADSLKGAQILSTPMHEPIDNTLQTPAHEAKPDVESFPIHETDTEQPGFDLHDQELFKDQGFTPHEGDINIIFEFEIDGKKFQEHHIISDKTRAMKNHKLWAKAGIDPQSRENKIFLPTAPEYHPTRSVHSGRHWSSVSKELEETMNEAINLGREQNWSQDQYKSKLQEIIREERADLRSGERALNTKMREWSDDKRK